MTLPGQSDSSEPRGAIDVLITGDLVSPDGESYSVHVAMLAEEEPITARPTLDFRIVEEGDGPLEAGWNLIVDERVLVRAIEVLREERMR